MKRRSGAARLVDKVRKKGEKSAQKKNGPDSDGVRVYISPTVFLMAVVFVAFGMAYEFACSLTAVILHELAHARVAKKLGYALNEVKLMPYGAALCGKADISHKHEVMIAAAGPAFNLVIGLIFAAMWWLVPISYAFTYNFCVCNLYIGLFNLLPVYPLDGGRVVLAFLSMRFSRNRAYKAMRVASFVFGLASISMFIVSAVYALNVCFLTVGLFMVISAFIPDERARYYALFSRAATSGKIARPTEKKVLAVLSTAPLLELAKSLDPDRFCAFDVYSENLERVCQVDEAEFFALVKNYGYEVAVGEAVRKSRNKLGLIPHGKP